MAPPAKRARTGGGDEIPSEEEILRLVAEREQARQARNYDESDAIRDTLKSMGVEVYDREKIWKSLDGRQGVLFTAGPQECSLESSDIQERIRQREHARRNKDFEQADSLRDELRSLGIELDDKSSTWRTSSRSGDYACTWTDDNALPGSSPQEKLISERERLRAAKDYEGADRVRRQLADEGVEVFDKERIWRSSDGRMGVIITGGHQGHCLLSDAEISRQVSRREEARSSKNWALADKVRDDLRKQGVELLDQHKSWVTTNGRQGSYGGSWSAPQSMQQLLPGAPPGRKPGDPWSATANIPVGSLGEAVLHDASIIALIHGRERARSSHKWAVADAIRSDLKNLGVEVWDKEQMWKASDGRSGRITKPSPA